MHTVGQLSFSKVRISSVEVTYQLGLPGCMSFFGFSVDEGFAET